MLLNSEETKKIAEQLLEVIENKKEDFIKEAIKFADKAQEEIMYGISDYFAVNVSDCYTRNLAHDVEKIIQALLVGDLETIKKLNIVSEYTFGHLHEIRMCIWKTCSKEIEKSIISAQQEEIDRLNRQLSWRINHE